MQPVFSDRHLFSSARMKTGMDRNVVSDPVRQLDAFFMCRTVSLCETANNQISPKAETDSPLNTAPTSAPINLRVKKTDWGDVGAYVPCAVICSSDCRFCPASLG